MSGKSTVPKEDIDRSTPDLDELIEIVRDRPRHRFRSMSLHKKTEHSLGVTVMKDAWEGAGIDLDEPGSVGQYYFEELDLVVLDLDQSRSRP